MKYVSIDIETTGLDADNNQILSIGAIIEDTNKPLSLENLPKLNLGILHKNITGSLFAINMNQKLISNILAFTSAKTEAEEKEIEKESGLKFVTLEEVPELLFRFLYINGMVPMDPNWINTPIVVVDGISYPAITLRTPKVVFTAAGKNFGTFDLKFLRKIPRWDNLFSVRSRILDPAILYTNWDIDEAPPSLEECKRRAGLLNGVSHNAIEDAYDVITLIRPFYTRTDL